MPEQRRLFNDTDSPSTSTLLKFLVSKPTSHDNARDIFAAASSLSSSDSDTTIKCEHEITRVENMSGTSNSIRNKSHQNSNAEMSSPVIRPTRASILREQHSKSAMKEGKDYALAIPQSNCHTVSSDHISSQKNGSPLPRKDRPNRSVTLNINQNVKLEGEKMLSSRFASKSAVSSASAGDDLEFTLIDKDEEDKTGVVMDRSGTVNSMKHRVTRLGVGPTMRLAIDARKMIFGETT